MFGALEMLKKILLHCWNTGVNLSLFCCEVQISGRSYDKHKVTDTAKTFHALPEWK